MPCVVRTLGLSVIDVIAFGAALLELKMAQAKVERVRASDGTMQKVDLAFKDGAGRDAGLAKTPQGLRVVSDSVGLTPQQAQAQRESIQRIVQRYAYKKAVGELQQKGFSVAEEQKLPDESIRLVLRRWS